MAHAQVTTTEMMKKIKQAQDIASGLNRLVRSTS